MLLLAHPATPCGVVRHFEVRAVRGADGRLRLGWRLDADLSRLKVPEPGDGRRADGLWRHTCFEAFLAGPGSPSYCELNFAPSGEWAAYVFTDYRTGMTPLATLVAPPACWRRDAQRLELEVELRAADFPAGIGAEALRVALAAVIEEPSGTISYWALRHPEGPPDFHCAAGFALDLAPLAGARSAGAAAT